MNFYLLQNYFTKILEDNLKAIIKPQYVDHIPKVSVATNMRLYGIILLSSYRGNIFHELFWIDVAYKSRQQKSS